MMITDLRPVLLVTAPLLLGFGLVLPLVRFETLYFFTEIPSLLAIVSSLWQTGNTLLCLIVILVSVVLPVMKMIGLAAEASGAGKGRAGSLFYHHVIPHLSKWSMMDVLLVAIVIVAAKGTGLASAFTQPGLWCYAGSAIISGLLHSLNEKVSGPK